ncbi:hypothetical protein CJU90_2721 [Yarrowia sp. C11]|nr:hypothetical protein CKK34_4169 [Yarrowia sp. E02]KAG5369266.1 hypothetical protein CJU90_2721 [Yarrowia sp. C11]
MSQPEAALNKAYSLAKSAQTAIANKDYGKAIEKHKEAAHQLLKAKKLSANTSVQRAIDTMYDHHIRESAKLEGLENSRLSRIARIDEEEAEELEQQQQQQRTLETGEVTRADMDFAQIIDRFVNLSISMNNQQEFDLDTSPSDPEDVQQTLSKLKVHVKALERNAQMRSTSLQSLGNKLRTELTEHNEATMRDLRAENAQLQAENDKLNAQMAKMKSKWDSLVQNALNKRKERG